ncbi:MAG: hypothetical protein GY928_37515 [Colwellia sp.]|nr:hypothetical protein [Colwellia sp.]
MANSIGLFKSYTDNLEEVYANASKTAVLDSSRIGTSTTANANEIVIPKMTIEGLANYSRNTGYVNGDVDITYQTVTFDRDRGKTFTVDNMDNVETAGVAFGQLSSTFIRTKSVPEEDAWRFAKYAGVSNIGVATPAVLADGTAVLAALLVSQSEMDDAEVPETDRHLFITPSHYNSISALDTTKSREVLSSFASIVKVPQKRFYTAITLGTDGYTKGSGGADINFFVIHKPALMQYTKHQVNKATSPADNQTSDGWKFFFRTYGLADVNDTMVAGLYLHASTS